MMDKLEEAVKAIEVAKAAMPELTTYGRAYPTGEKCFVLGSLDFDKARNNFDPENVATCLEFIRLCERNKNPTMSSYGLKHSAERWGRSYVTNGEFIAAALYLDVPMKPLPDTPNLLIALAWRSVKKLEERKW